MCFFLCFHLVQGSRFRVQGRGGGFAAFFIGRSSKVAFKSPVTRHSYDTRERIVSHVWHEILRLSPHLFWLGLFTHRAFLSAQDDDTRRRKGSYLGDTLHVLELAVLYYDTSSPLEKGRAEGAGWICPAGASFYVTENVLLAGIVSHAWHEILRLSPHLFWLGVTHRAFSSAQDDDTRERNGSHLGDTLHVWGLAVLYYDTSSPLEKGRTKGAGWIHKAV